MYCNEKIMVADDPMQVLRTRTRGIGTETYRAPEVNSGKAYDPAAADVWGLGVMLFFFVSHSFCTRSFILAALHLIY